MRMAVITAAGSPASTVSVACASRSRSGRAVLIVVVMPRARDYVLDLAEIPTLQEGPRVRRPGFVREIDRRHVITVDGRRAELEPLMRRARSRPGAAGLKTLRFEAVYLAKSAGTSLRLEDRNFGSRVGWRDRRARRARRSNRAFERSRAEREPGAPLLPARPPAQPARRRARGRALPARVGGGRSPGARRCSPA